MKKSVDLKPDRCIILLILCQGQELPVIRLHTVFFRKNDLKQNKRKKKRRKPWIRYERKHSLTAVHLDWHTSRFNGKEVCVVLDDSSRLILSGGEFTAATAEASIDLVRIALKDYGEIQMIREVITKLIVNSELFSPFLVVILIILTMNLPGRRVRIILTSSIVTTTSKDAVRLGKVTK